MYNAQTAGENLTLEIPVTGDRNVPLTPGETVVVRLDRLQDHRADNRYWGQYDGIVGGSGYGTIRTIFGQYRLNGLSLTVDQPDYGPTTDRTRGVGMYPVLFIRSLFTWEGYFPSGVGNAAWVQNANGDFSSGVFTGMCNATLLPRYVQRYLYGIPSIWMDDRLNVGSESNVCGLTFQRP
jgi:hypothetical protein